MHAGAGGAKFNLLRLIPRQVPHHLAVSFEQTLGRHHARLPNIALELFAELVHGPGAALLQSPHGARLLGKGADPLFHGFRKAHSRRLPFHAGNLAGHRVQLLRHLVLAVALGEKSSRRAEQSIEILSGDPHRLKGLKCWDGGRRLRFRGADWFRFCPEHSLDGLKRRSDTGGRTVFAESGHAVFAGVERLLHHRGHLLVKQQHTLAHAREQRLQTMGQAFHGVQIHSASRSLQTVGAAKGLLEVNARGLPRGLPDHRQQRANLFHVIAVLDLKRGQQFLTNVFHQIRYLSTAFWSCCASAVRLTAAFSSWCVLAAYCWLACPRSRTACITWVKPICCWLAPATICWNACTLC